MSVQGCIRIETRLTQGDENGIYRITENKLGYLMLAFEEQDEAREAAKVLAKLLKVPFKDHLYTETHLTGAVSGRMDSSRPNEANAPKRTLSAAIDVSVPVGAVRPKPKKVMGALKLCKELFSRTGMQQLNESEVLQRIRDKYLIAGHSEGSAQKFAAEVLRVVKKG